MTDDRLDFLHRVPFVGARANRPAAGAPAILQNCQRLSVATDRTDVRQISEKDVTLFAVLAEVEALNFVALADAQSHGRVEHLDNDKCSHDGNADRRAGTDALIHKLLGVSL